MKRNGLIKRIFSGFLAFLMVLPFLPVLPVLANAQAPVEQFEIRSVTGDGRNYTLRMEWIRPPAMGGSPPANYAGTPASWVTHRATSYDIMRFDAFTNEPTLAWGGWTEVMQNISNQSEIIIEELSQNLDFGRFFAYQIRARHTHSIIPAVPGGPTSDTVISQPTDNMVYFMTDLQVEAEGQGSSLTVRWTVPQLDGEDPFDGYQIAFELRAGGTRSTVDVNVLELLDDDDPNVRIVNRPGGARMYEVDLHNLSDLQAGRSYNVWVEPMMGSATRHTLSSSGGMSGLADAFDFELVHTNPVTNPFMATNVFVRPEFTLQPIGMNYILLSWSRLDDGRQARIWREDSGVWVQLAHFSGTAAEHTSHLLLERPSANTRYRITFYDVNGNAIEDSTQYVIFDVSAGQFAPTRPNIQNVTDTAVLGTAPPLGLVVTWDAFMRRPFTAEEAASNNMFDGFLRDPDIVYDIWITDDGTVFEGATEPSLQWRVSPPAGLTQDMISGGFDQDDFAWTHTFTQFRDSEGVLRDIEPNRVYYIRIVARRTVPDEQESSAAYASWFVFGNALQRPSVIPRPPLHINQTASGLTNLNLAWLTEWVEAFELPTNANPTGTWHSAFGLRGGSVVFDEQVVAPDRWTINPSVTALHTLGDQAAIGAAFGSLAPPLRTQRLPHPATNYLIHIVPMEELLADEPEFTSDFEAFVRRLMGNPAAWANVSASALTVDGVNVSLNIEGLEPNTTYAIFIRPANVAGQAAWLPTFITGTTGNERDDLEITPPAPFLDAYDWSDRWLEFVLRPFSADGSLRYEFYINELPNRDDAWEFDPNPENGRIFPHSTIGDRRIFMADNLFPETTYYIWVRAVSASNPERYAWSAALTMQTNPIEVPPPPRGLGLAGPHEVNIINLENDTQFSRQAPDHMMISFLPLRGHPTIPNDTNLPMETVEGENGTTIFGSELIDYVYMLLFEDLVPNRAYWVRARTIYSVHRDGVGGEITDRIDYIVQLSASPDFMDAITVYIMPDADEIAAGLHVRMAVSVWTDAFRFFTTRDDGEFDTDVVAELHPLPMHDFEIIYDQQTRTLTFRFRSTGVDANGHRDNLVDQRFISRLIQTGVFSYEIDMTTYNNQPVNNRVIELPYSIITAFEERGITFSVVANQTTYALNPGFASTPQNSGFGRDSRLRMYINNLDPQPALSVGRSYATTPQNLAINVVNPTNRVSLSTLAAPLTATHSINRAMAMDFNVGAYVRTPDDADWRRSDSIYSENTGTVSTTTTRPSNFAAIMTAVPQQFNTPPHVRDALHFINSHIILGDMDWFAPDLPINAWQINNMIYAIATGQRSVELNSELSNQQFNALVNSRMLVPGADTVARQDAMAGLVRLFEARTGRQVSSVPSLNDSFFADIVTADPAFVRAMLQAESLGFLDYATGIANPHGELTLGEAMLIFEIILRN